MKVEVNYNLIDLNQVRVISKSPAYMSGRSILIYFHRIEKYLEVEYTDISRRDRDYELLLKVWLEL